MDPKQERLKLWVLYAADEDERLAKASTAGLAILTQDNKDACVRITKDVRVSGELWN